MGKSKRSKNESYPKRWMDHPVVILVMGVLGIALGIFFIVSQGSNTPVSREEAVAYSGAFDRYDTEWENYRDLYLADGSCHFVYPHTETEEFRQKMESLEKGTMLYILVNPNNEYVAEIKTDTEELLNFEQSQQAIASYDDGYVWLGAFACFGGVFLIVYVIAASKAKQKETERHRDKKNSASVLRYADPAVKSRILLETEVEGYRICYRRVKSTNELVVNGQVYDEKKAIIEFEHQLVAVVGGHTIEAGYDSDSYSYIAFDGELVEYKKRWI